MNGDGYDHRAAEAQADHWSSMNDAWDSAGPSRAASSYGGSASSHDAEPAPTPRDADRPAYRARSRYVLWPPFSAVGNRNLTDEQYRDDRLRFDRSRRWTIAGTALLLAAFGCGFVLSMSSTEGARWVTGVLAGLALLWLWATVEAEFIDPPLGGGGRPLDD